MREVRLPLPGAVVRVAEAAARHAGARSAAVRVRHLPREPRPGRELRVRAAAAPARRRPARLRAMTALLLLGPGDADAVPGAGVRRRRRRSSTSPITSRSCASRPRAAGASSSRSSPACAIPRSQRGAALAGRRATRSSAASWILPSASATPRRYALHRDLLRCGAAIRCSAQPARAVDGAVLGTGGAACCAISVATPGDRLLIVNLGLRPRAHAGAGAAARAAGRSATGGWRGAARRRATAARARRRSIRPATGASPANARCCFGPAPRRTRMTDTDRHPDDSCSRTMREPDEPMPRREWLVTNGLGGYAPARSRASSRAATTACSSPRCRRRSAAS